MIPALLLTPLAKKLGGAVAVVLAVLFLMYQYGANQYAKGRAAVQHAWDESIARQAAEAQKEVLARDARRQSDVQAHAVTVQKLQARIEAYQRKERDHVAQPLSPCQPPPGAVELFDAARGLLNYPNGVPAAPTTAGAPNESSETGFTTPELLRGYQRGYGECAVKLAKLWEEYEGLVKELRESYLAETESRQAGTE